MATCLFTGVDLPPDTTPEHVIPEALGGRITSRTVDSSQFNNKSSSADCALSSMYRDLLRYLGPLLPSSSKAGNEVGFGHGGMSISLDANGSPRVRKMKVDRSEDGSVETIWAASIDQAQPLLSHLGKSSDEVEYEYFPIEDVRLERKYSEWAEIAALKSILVTLDVILERDGRPRFTRDDVLQPVREFVRQAVMDGIIDRDGYVRHVMGMQFEKIPVLESLRTEVVTEPVRDFEHVILVSGNVACHCLDAVWLVAGVDPFGFRLTRAWSGCDFTYVNAIGMLRNDSRRFWGWIERPEYLCGPTTNTLAQCCATDAEANERVDALLVRRNERLNKQAGLACIGAEACDEYLLNELPISAAQLAKTDALYNNPRRVLCKRLNNIFRLTPQTDEQRATLERLISSVAQHPLAVRRPTWRYWVMVYRAALQAIVDELGMPKLLPVYTRSVEFPNS